MQNTQEIARVRRKKVPIKCCEVKIFFFKGETITEEEEKMDKVRKITILWEMLTLTSEITGLSTGSYEASK